MTLTTLLKFNVKLSVPPTLNQPKTNGTKLGGWYLISQKGAEKGNEGLLKVLVPTP